MISWILSSSIFFTATLGWAKPVKQIHIVTYDLPPFAKEGLPEGGAAISVFKEIFRKQGYSLKVTFAPVIRAKKQAVERADVVGYFPAVAENLQKNFILSRSVHQSTWGVVENVDRPVIWKNVSDLTKYRIGNVVGYDLAGNLKAYAKNLNIEEANSDELNLQKVAKGRLDLAFVDKSVFQRLIQTSEKLRPIKAKIQFNPRPIQVYQYSIAFKNSPDGKEALRVFNAAFVESEFLGLVDSYLRHNKDLLP